MSKYWPHTPYAEEQPLSRTILYTHVLVRGMQTGAIVGPPIGLLANLVRRKPLTPFMPFFLRSSAMGVAVTSASMMVGLPVRMWDQEEIQWKDRSWRILENKGQMECDNWTYGGMFGGLLWSGLNSDALGWRGLVGRVGFGSALGTAGYMGYRYGYKGGWEEEIVV